MFLTLALIALPVCRYTVRDIGFVDLVGSEYRLGYSAPKGATPGSDASVLLGVLARDGNVSFSAVADAVAPSGWWLARDGLDPIALPVSGSDGASAQEAWRSAVQSPLRDQILAESLTSFAALVRIRGTDPAEEARIDAVLAEASSGLGVLSNSLPRPVDRPLVTFELQQDRLQEERVCLWALGLGVAPGSALAVVYGRGKLAGSVMVGEEITLEETLSQLALVGESCECDTSRDWFNEPRLPMRWTDRQRARAAAELGFDPESPMVKSEVVRILERGPLTGEVPREGAVDGIEALVFGYREVEIGGQATPPPRRDFVPDGGAPLGQPVQILEPADGDDWGFDSGTDSSTVTTPGTGGEDKGSTLLLVVVGFLSLLGLGLVAAKLVGLAGDRRLG